MSSSSDNLNELQQLRAEISKIDGEIIRLIGERVQIGQKIGVEKGQTGQPVMAPDREAAVVRKAAELASENGLPEEDVRKIMWILIGISRKSQQE